MKEINIHTTVADGVARVVLDHPPLNILTRAMRGELDVTAVSFHAYAHLTRSYALLPHGASIGDRYGPRLVAREAAGSDPRATVRGKRVAVPGPLTTAFLALKLYQPEFEPVMTPFDRIEDVVLAGEVDAGLLIHEGQLTYARRGLHLWVDLGEWWDRETGLPLPEFVRPGVLESLVGGGFLALDEHRLRATPAGLRRLNAVLVSLLG